MRRRLLVLTFPLAALLSPLQAAQAAWPDRPIRVIVPSAAGGAPDVLMRALWVGARREADVDDQRHDSQQGEGDEGELREHVRAGGPR